MRILKSSQFTLPSPTFVGADGETAADTASTPTCTVSREDGTALSAATVSHHSDSGALGSYTAAITTTHTSQVDRLAITWTGTSGSQVQVYTDTLEVVGAHYFTIPEMRAFSRSMSDTSKWPIALLRDVRDEFEDRVESICGRAFVRRYERDRLDGDGSSTLLLSRRNPRSVLSVTVNGESQTAADFTVHRNGTVHWDNGAFTPPDSTNGDRNVLIAYEHGDDAPRVDLKREGLKWCANRIFETVSGLPEGAQSLSPEGQGSVRMFTADPSRGKPTGIPSLDAVLMDLGLRTPGFA